MLVSQSRLLRSRGVARRGLQRGICAGCAGMFRSQGGMGWIGCPLPCSGGLVL
jgi:hypothetical protein